MNTGFYLHCGFVVSWLITCVLLEFCVCMSIRTLAGCLNFSSVYDVTACLWEETLAYFPRSLFQIPDFILCFVIYFCIFKELIYIYL